MTPAHHDQNTGLMQGAPCAACAKPAAVCVCDRLVTAAVETRVLILQHPQEQDLLLGSAPLLMRVLPHAKRVVGLSWPSLSAAWGEPAARERWAVLYPNALPRPLTTHEQGAPWVLMDARGGPLSTSDIDGIVALDGTWSQAKSLWWRNPWLLRLARLTLQAGTPSAYGRLRREPRKGCVSTLESVAAALTALGAEAEVEAGLRRAFRTLVQRVRDLPGMSAHLLRGCGAE